ncbi:hypothetical protein CVT26_005415 [Gymnopilus dilepis]|uniref:HTH CENPB-type domain-containing protein n=1 Tax=Gymnopilus dilepis TaxID=231916 RepID=A0A409WGH3_9AGAR|nr:hypothetical protein CVT26_005415 [Gymnopilus dilepis]
MVTHRQTAQSRETLEDTSGLTRSTTGIGSEARTRLPGISRPDELSRNSSKYPEIEEEMQSYLQDWSDQGIVIRDDMIRDRALEIARFFGISAARFKGSQGWIDKFKRRHRIRGGEWLKDPAQLRIINVTGAPIYSRRMPRSNSQDAPGSSMASRGTEHDYSSLDIVPPSTQQIAQVEQLQRRDCDDDSGSEADSEQWPLDAVIRGARYRGQDQLQSLSPKDDILPSETRVPTLAEAELALNTVITFIDNCETELIDRKEYETLFNVKYALFNFANGIPFERCYE